MQKNLNYKCNADVRKRSDTYQDKSAPKKRIMRRYNALNTGKLKSVMKDSNPAPKRESGRQRYASNPSPKKEAERKRYTSNPLPKKNATRRQYRCNPAPQITAVKRRYACNPDANK